MTQDLKYGVKTFRAVGLEAKWTKTRTGAPIIVARNPLGKLQHQREIWWVVDDSMWQRIKQWGILEAFDRSTLLGDFFSVTV
jgi:hypothetical protein